MNRVKLVVLATRTLVVQVSHSMRPEDVTLHTPECKWVHDDGSQTWFQAADDLTYKERLAGVQFASCEWRCTPPEEMRVWLLGRTTGETTYP